MPNQHNTDTHTRRKQPPTRTHDAPSTAVNVDQTRVGLPVLVLRHIDTTVDALDAHALYATPLWRIRLEGERNFGNEPHEPVPHLMAERQLQQTTLYE